jgi:predicted transcriptional regulator
MKQITIMDLRTKKYTMIEKIMQLDEKAVEKLEASLNEILGEVSIEQYNRELDEANAAIDRGEYVEHADAIKRIRSWREK